MRTQRSGFTLIETLITLGLLAIIAGIVFVVINPGGQLAQSRNSARKSHIRTILNVVHQNKIDNQNAFTCASGPLPAASTTIASTGGYDLGVCLIPAYIPVLPFDPSAPGAHYSSKSDYNTGYKISIDADGVISVFAPDAELGEEIKASL